MLKAKPITRGEANHFILKHHRHHKPSVGYKFAIACMDGAHLCGVAICGRPVSRRLDDGLTIELTRLCTDGTKHAASFLIARSARIAREMGYEKIITYTLESETGVSFIAAGWTHDGSGFGGEAWNSSGAIERTSTLIDLFGVERKYPPATKSRWSKCLV